MRFVILHYHILKNAGSTIEDFLDHSFGEKFIRLDRPDDRDSVIDAQALHAIVRETPPAMAISSHHIRYPLPVDPEILFFDICFLRDPVDRVRSMYDYFRQNPAPGDPVSQLANESAPGAFVEGMVTRFPLQVRDVQVNLIAAAGDSDEPDRGHLELAFSRMMKASFLGVVDLFDESVHAGQYFLQAVFPRFHCALPPANVSGGLEGTLERRRQKLQSVCEPAVWQELLRITALDAELVECARDEVRRRLRLVPSRTIPAVQKVRSLARATRMKPVQTVKRILQAVPYLPYFMKREGLFDKDYYRAAYPEATASGVNPLLHFIAAGAFEGFNPHPLFDTEYYLRKYPDVAASGRNALGHYLKFGYRRNFQPHPLFDPVFYLNRYPDVHAAGVNPLHHYVHHGSWENRKPHPLFEPEYYLDQCPEAGRGGGNPLVHFIESASGSCNPHRLFDCESYWRGNPAFPAGEGGNALATYVSSEHMPDSLAREVAGFDRVEMTIDDVPTTVLMRQNGSGAGQLVTAPEQRRFALSLNRDQLAARRSLRSEL